MATLGVIVADRIRMTGKTAKAIEIANAIEALACWCALESNGWKRDARVRGVQKLAGKSNLTFPKLRQSSFYVTQPMRMATVEALVDLDFVQDGSQRFNSFRCTQNGRDFVEAATARYRPYNGSIEDYLVRLASDNSVIGVTTSLREALSPLELMDSAASDLLRSKLCEGAGRDKNAARRKNALTWVSSLQPDRPADWSAKPPAIEAGHWNDLQLGAYFFEARDAAIDALNDIESAMAPLHTAKLSIAKASKIPAVEKRLAKLRRSAQKFLKMNDDPTEGQIASDFCRDCIKADPSKIIRSLVLRDNRVLVLREEDILPGPAYVGQAQTDNSDDVAEGPGPENTSRVPVPEGISPRIQNLYLLAQDLDGKLSAFLNPPSAKAAA